MPFDLAILDQMMPDMDGLALARAIKADPAIAATPLVLLTPFGQTVPAEALLAAGIARSLFKPVRPAQLFEGLERALRPELSAETRTVRRPPPSRPRPGSPATTASSSPRTTR